MLTISHEGCDAVVHELGAWIASWKPAGGREVLFVSRETVVDPSVEVHGGIPVCAPWFAFSRTPTVLPKHGFARYSPWQLIERIDESALTTLTWRLNASDVGFAAARDYPASLWMEYTMRLGSTLEVELTLGANEDFVAEEALHTYFLVNNVHTTGISGLADTPYTDYAPAGAQHTARAGDPVPVPVDRVYRGTPPAIIHDADRDIHISSSGTSSTVLWTPGPQGAKRLEYFASDEWPHLLCLEVGNVKDDAVTIPAGAQHTMRMQVEVTT